MKRIFVPSSSGSDWQRLLAKPELRYQLLHRTASALLTARDFHASAAVMLVQSFSTPMPQRADFEACANALNAVPVAGSLYRVPLVEAPALHLGWVEGDSRFRSKQLGREGKMNFTAVFERRSSTMPRHREINEMLAKKICKDLEVAPLR